MFILFCKKKQKTATQIYFYSNNVANSFNVKCILVCHSYFIDIHLCMIIIRWVKECVHVAEWVSAVICILCVCVCVLAVCLEKVRFWCSFVLFISGSYSVVLILETIQLSLVIESVCTLLGLWVFPWVEVPGWCRKAIFLNLRLKLKPWWWIDFKYD